MSDSLNTLADIGNSNLTSGILFGGRSKRPLSTRDICIVFQEGDMRRILMIGLFIVGLAMVIPFNGMSWWGLDDSFYGMLFIAIFAVAAVLVIIGMSTKNRERWLAFTLASVMFLGLSLGYLFSLGFILAPVALSFFVISVWRLVRS